MHSSSALVRAPVTAMPVLISNIVAMFWPKTDVGLRRVHHVRAVADVSVEDERGRKSTHSARATYRTCYKYPCVW